MLECGAWESSSEVCSSSFVPVPAGWSTSSAFWLKNKQLVTSNTFGLWIKSEVWLPISGWLLDAGELKGHNHRGEKESHVFSSETKTEKKENP